MNCCSRTEEGLFQSAADYRSALAFPAYIKPEFCFKITFYHFVINYIPTLSLYLRNKQNEHFFNLASQKEILHH